MTEKILEAKNITLVKGKQTILNIEHFYLQAGETLALIGPNGSGKSTLMQVLMMLLRPTTGELFFNGEKINWKNSILYRRRMAMVFQEPLLLDTTVAENVASGLKIRGYEKGAIRTRVEEWLKRMRIEHLADRTVRYLSGGEAQRVSLARAMAMGPEVLFLDEPFSALDAPTRTGLIAELSGILQDSRISSVFVTHDYTEIPLLAGRVVALENGRVAQTGPPHEILTRPGNLTVASLVGVENVIPGRIAGRDGETLTVQAGPHVVIAGGAKVRSGKVLMLIRPEDVKLDGCAGSSRMNRIKGRIEKLLPHGGLFKAVVDCGFPLTMLLNPEQVLGGVVAAGEEVTVCFDARKIHLLDEPS
ncbi:MAG: ABC transporter ATP-binding protein [Firmicutes bacterium]|nr:ABC transporter ATP-binding protein [Bacillota bacterium]